MKKIKKISDIFLKNYFYIIIFLVLLNISLGSWYLVVLMEKVKTNDHIDKLMKENSQLNADISRIKLEIDKQVDLGAVKDRATRELQMELIPEVKYIVVD